MGEHPGKADKQGQDPSDAGVGWTHEQVCSKEPAQKIVIIHQHYNVEIPLK